MNVWYSYDNDSKTAVSTKTFNYSENMNVPLKNNVSLSPDAEIIVRGLKQPTVGDVSVNNNKVELTIEKELGVEIVGETKIKVPIEEDEDDYVEITDDNEVDKIVEEIDTEYLN